VFDIIQKINLGSFPQKIHIRGEKETNPVLLILHGGPGIPNRSSFFKHHSDLCEFFTVAAWDQRGTGGSYRGIDKNTLTVERLVIDARELVEYLCERFCQQKIFLLCGSWGTQLGTILAYRYPEHIAAYAGLGQTVNGCENERISYEFALKKASEADDSKSVALLQKYGPPVNGQYKEGLKGLLAQRRVMKKYGGNSTKKGGWFKTLGIPILFSKEYTLGDKIGIIKGYKLVLSTMWPLLTDYDFIAECADFQMPYFIFQGRLDNNTPSALVSDFYDRITAPQKDLVWFEKSAHSPLGEEPELFKRILKQKFLDSGISAKLI
jgi:pimeloyl-ACP methyl ester carboxylesterase